MIPKTDDLIALICKAASEKFREDRVRPGVQIAHIPAQEGFTIGLTGPIEPRTEPGFWYVALHRYPNPPSGSRLHLDRDGRALPPGCPEVRQVVFKAKHEDLDRAIQLLALNFAPIEAQADLIEAMRTVKKEEAK